MGMKRCDRFVWVLGLGAALSGCASMADLGPQDIQLSVMPETAKCDAYQNGAMVAAYDASRRTLTVPGSPFSLEILCSAPGYKDRRVSISPGNAAWDQIGVVLVDFGPADAAPSRYPATLQIAMEPADRQGNPRD